MAIVQIKIKVDSGAFGPAGQSDTHIPLGSTVTLQNATSATTYQWTLISQPNGFQDTFVDSGGITSTAASPSFVITKEGSYLVRLIINEGLGDEATGKVICAVRELQTGNRIPAAQETTEVNPDEGWAIDAVTNVLQRVTRLTDSGFFVAKAKEAMVAGNVVHLSGISSLGTGSNERPIPEVNIAHASTLIDVDGPLGVMISGTDPAASSVDADELCRVMIYGALPAHAMAAGGNVGDPVFVDDDGELSLTAGTYVRQVGDVAKVISAGTYDIAISAGSNSIPRGNALGDLSGAYPDPTVAKINGTAVTTAGDSLTTGQVLRATGASSADWGAVDLANSDAVTGVLPIGKGGTGSEFFGLTIGSVAYANTIASMAFVTPVAERVLLSNGSGVAPSFSQLNLGTSAVFTGTLPVSKGGTGQAVDLTLNGLVYASSTSAMATTAAGTAGQLLIGGAGAPSWLAAGTSGYILKSNGAAAPSWLQAVPIANGGTGAALASITANGLIYAATSLSMASTGTGSAGQAMISGGSGSAPGFGALNLATLANTTAGSALPVSRGGTGLTSLLETYGVLTTSGPGALNIIPQAIQPGVFLSNGGYPTPADPPYWATFTAAGQIVASYTSGGSTVIGTQPIADIYKDYYASTTTAAVVPTYSSPSDGAFSTIITAGPTALKVGTVVATPGPVENGNEFLNYIITNNTNNYTAITLKYTVTGPVGFGTKTYSYQYRSAVAHNNGQVTGSLSFPALSFYATVAGNYTISLAAAANATLGVASGTLYVSYIQLTVSQG